MLDALAYNTIRPRHEVHRQASLCATGSRVRIINGVVQAGRDADGRWLRCGCMRPVANAVCNITTNSTSNSQLFLLPLRPSTRSSTHAHVPTPPRPQRRTRHHRLRDQPNHARTRHAPDLNTDAARWRARKGERPLDSPGNPAARQVEEGRFGVAELEEEPQAVGEQPAGYAGEALEGGFLGGCVCVFCSLSACAFNLGDCVNRARDMLSTHWSCHKRLWLCRGRGAAWPIWRTRLGLRRRSFLCLGGLLRCGRFAFPPSRVSRRSGAGCRGAIAENGVLACVLVRSVRVARDVKYKQR